MSQELTYEQALSRVEQIAAEIEKGHTDLDQLAEQLREARDLLAQATNLPPERQPA